MKKLTPLFAALMLSNLITSYSNETVPTTNEQAESGSLEAIAETPFRTRDDYTGSTMVIYPSVLNETRVAKGNFSALRFYIAPLCVIIIPDKFKTFTGRTSNEVMYSFEMLNFHPQMELQAKQYVTEQLQSSTDSKFKATGGNISRLTHQQVTFKLPDFSAIKIDPIGTVFEDRSLNDTLKLNMYVPINDKARFEEMVQAGSVNMDVKIYYIGKNVKIASMSWSAAELKNTEAYKKIDSSGAQFVNAQQLDDMVRETVQRKDITIFQDPGIPEQLTAKVQNMFDKFLNIQGEDALFIKNQDEARQIEKEILAGTGLTAEEFKPIVTMWEITEQLKDETDYKKANQKMQEYMKDKSERSKIATDIHMSGSGGIDLGIFDASASMSANFSYENEKTKHDVDKGYFASQDAFNEFRSKHHTERGMEPRITPRGLNLVETKKFKDNLSMTASAVAYYPVDKTRQLGITGAFIENREKIKEQENIVKEQQEREKQAWEERERQEAQAQRDREGQEQKKQDRKKTGDNLTADTQEQIEPHLASYIAVNNNGETILYVRPFDGQTFGPVSSNQMVSSGDGWCGWSWNGSTASYIAVNSKRETVLYVRPFDGQTFGTVSSSQMVSSGDGWRGWSWNGSTASYIAVNNNGETILYVRPFDGQTFGPVSSSQMVSSGDGWRGWSWNGSTASYIAVNSKRETVLYVRPFDGQTFGPVLSSQMVSSGDGWRGWSWF